MKTSRIYNLNDEIMSEIRKELTEKISGHSLIPEGLSTTRVAITKVDADGEFSIHRDMYHHVLYCFSGIGVGLIDTEEYDFRPGTIVEIPAGTPHGYKNTSDEPLFLVTINIPVS